MNWRHRIGVIILTNLVAFLVGVVLLLFSSYYFTNEPWITISTLLGSYLTISVVVNLLYRSFLKPSEDSARKKELEVLLDERINAILGNSIKYGFAGFIQKMDFRGLYQALENEDTLWWLDTYCPAHEEWHDELRSAISRGATINMLILSPDSKYAVDRANEIGGTYSVTPFINGLKNFKKALEIIQAESKNEPGTLEIVEYSDRPGMPAYIVANSDGSIFGFSSLFLGKPTGVAFPHIMKWIMSEFGMVQHLHEYIKAKWNRNYPRPDVSARS